MAKKNHWNFIMASDPQFPWTAKTDDTDEKDWPYKEDDPVLYAKNQTASMITLIDDENMNVKGVMFNGDLVAFNAYPFSDIDNFQKYYTDVLKEKVPVYLGLGNHDYENNVHDTFEERGPTQMVSLAYDSLEEENVKKTITGKQFLQVADHDGTLQTRFRGSFAYSFEINGVRFIQLNNYPSYTNSWNGFNSEKAREYNCAVSSSMYWLERELGKARNDGLPIIVCMHYPPTIGMNDDDENHFCRLMYKYEVSAVFCGHFHTLLGKQGVIKKPDEYSHHDDIYYFHCGSTSQATYLMLDFYDGTTDDGKEVKYMRVNEISSVAIDGQGAYTILNPEKEEDPDLFELIATTPETPYTLVKSEQAIICWNKGAYVAQFTGKYTDSAGKEQDLSSGNKPVNSKHVFILPANSELNSLKGKAKWGETIFSGKTQTNCTYKVGGTSLITNWETTTDFSDDWTE